LTGCFTGVESTPKITYRDVKDKKAEASSPEEALATSFVQPRFSEWQNGKQLYVTSERIGLVMTTEGTPQKMPAEGDTLVFRRSREVTDLTGKDVIELMFTTHGSSDTLSYRTNATVDQLMERSQVEVPFTIDLDQLALVREAITGKELFVKTPHWFNRDGGSYHGRKFVKVRITDLIPANEIYPYMVIFSDDRGQEHALYMSAAAGSRWAPREFASLFTFSDPRMNYPRITDDTWQNIVNSRVAKGMTKSEASLALGAPRSIDRGHDQSAAYERWTYPDGIYLIFEDGLLVKTNQ
ncbi:MAG: hypothetical protein K2L78_04715, partial [Muribaculaceae bacterium]|nr:hypothetical protein [Muribaculaceae bacterium]